MLLFRTVILIVATCAALSADAGVSAIDTMPSVLDVQREALKHAKYDISEIASWKRKSRLAAFVPRVQFDFGKRLRNNINIGIQDNVYVGSSGIVVGPEEGDYTNARSSDLTIGMRAVWEFGEAVFNSKQLAVSAESRRAVRDRNLLMADINRHYYNVAGYAEEARLLLASAIAAKRPELVRLKVHQRRVSCHESIAQLDAMTGGWFSKGISNREALCESGRSENSGG